MHWVVKPTIEEEQESDENEMKKGLREEKEDEEEEDGIGSKLLPLLRKYPSAGLRSRILTELILRTTRTRC